jgi:hypothetical protein
VVFQDINPPKKIEMKKLKRLFDNNISYTGLSTDQADKLSLLARLKKWWKKLNRNLRFAIISIGLLLFGAIALGYYYLIYPKGEPVLEITRQQRPVTTIASPLTGIQVDPELTKRPVTGIMIENSLDARPQSGIEQAGVVFEAIAEGGITRFLALYQEAQPQYIGPVRSLRPYYIDWAASFDAPIAHVGGSPEALQQIRNGGKDLDQFFNPSAYWRQSTRAAPHNVYTSFKNLDALNQSKGYTSSKFTPWPRKKDSPLKTPTATTINVNISSSNFNSSYNYDANTNSYLRNQAGRQHLVTSSPDDKAPKQINPKVIIVLVMAYGIASDGQHSVYNTYGQGTALIFQDGGVENGTWHKANRADQITFMNPEGKTIELNAGQTWVVVVADKNKVTYTAPQPAAPKNQ